MKIGDIVKIFAPVAGYEKYHFCVCIPENGNAGCFLFLNSDPTYKDCLAVDCNRIPCLPVSKTGKTAISFSLLMRYNEEKLRLYSAQVIGDMPKDVLAEMIEFTNTVTSLPSNDRATLLGTLNKLK